MKMGGNIVAAKKDNVSQMSENGNNKNELNERGMDLCNW